MAQSEHLKELLKPDVLFELGSMVSGPLDLLQLKDRLERFNLTRNVRPGDSEAVELLVQFKPETWRALNRLAKRLASQGKNATPAEVASLLVECSLEKTGTEG